MGQARGEEHSGPSSIDMGGGYMIFSVKHFGSEVEEKATAYMDLDLR